jgi:hypothetical protein
MLMMLKRMITPKKTIKFVGRLAITGCTTQYTSHHCRV